MTFFRCISFHILFSLGVAQQNQQRGKRSTGPLLQSCNENHTLQMYTILTTRTGKRMYTLKMEFSIYIYNIIFLSEYLMLVVLGRASLSCLGGSTATWTQVLPWVRATRSPVYKLVGNSPSYKGMKGRYWLVHWHHFLIWNHDIYEQTKRGKEERKKERKKKRVLGKCYIGKTILPYHL